MTKVWKELDDCDVLLGFISEKLTVVSVIYPEEERIMNSNECVGWSAISGVEDVHPCVCSRYFLKPANVTFSGIPIEKITVFCLQCRPLLTRFYLAAGGCVSYTHYSGFEPLLETPAGVMIEEDEFAPLSFLFGLLPREHYDEAGLTNTDLSTWKWKSKLSDETQSKELPSSGK